MGSWAEQCLLATSCWSARLWKSLSSELCVVLSPLQAQWETFSLPFEVFPSNFLTPKFYNQKPAISRFRDITTSSSHRISHHSCLQGRGMNPTDSCVACSTSVLLLWSMPCLEGCLWKTAILVPPKKSHSHSLFHMVEERGGGEKKERGRNFIFRMPFSTCNNFLWRGCLFAHFFSYSVIHKVIMFIWRL